MGLPAQLSLAPLASSGFLVWQRPSCLLRGVLLGERCVQGQQLLRRGGCASGSPFAALGVGVGQARGPGLLTAPTPPRVLGAAAPTTCLFLTLLEVSLPAGEGGTDFLLSAGGVSFSH